MDLVTHAIITYRVKDELTRHLRHGLSLQQHVIHQIEAMKEITHCVEQDNQSMLRGQRTEGYALQITQTSGMLERLVTFLSTDITNSTTNSINSSSSNNNSSSFTPKEKASLGSVAEVSYSALQLFISLVGAQQVEVTRCVITSGALTVVTHQLLSSPILAITTNAIVFLGQLASHLYLPIPPAPPLPSFSSSSTSGKQPLLLMSGNDQEGIGMSSREGNRNESKRDINSRGGSRGDTRGEKVAKVETTGVEFRDEVIKASALPALLALVHDEHPQWKGKINNDDDETNDRIRQMSDSEKREKGGMDGDDEDGLPTLLLRSLLWSLSHLFAGFPSPPPAIVIPDYLTFGNTLAMDTTPTSLFPDPLGSPLSSSSKNPPLNTSNKMGDPFPPNSLSPSGGGQGKIVPFPLKIDEPIMDIDTYFRAQEKLFSMNGIIPTLLPWLFHVDEEVVLHTCWCLRYLSINEGMFCCTLFSLSPFPFSLYPPTLLSPSPSHPFFSLYSHIPLPFSPTCHPFSPYHHPPLSLTPITPPSNQNTLVCS